MDYLVNRLGEASTWAGIAAALAAGAGAAPADAAGWMQMASVMAAAVAAALPGGRRTVRTRR